jgi:2-polyprenyl-6-methoxyphenol hydroxylase-like FAD-dependent oxidoreductase
VGTSSKGRIAVVGAGPAGMATALAAHRAGFEVTIYERRSALRPAGNILNLWPPPQKVLGEATPGQILSQLDEISAVEARRAGAAAAPVA